VQVGRDALEYQVGRDAKGRAKDKLRVILSAYGQGFSLAFFAVRVFIKDLPPLTNYGPMTIMKAIILILVSCIGRQFQPLSKNGGWIMKKISPWLVLFAILSLSLAGSSYAGPMMRGGDWGMHSQYGRMFNPKTVETVSGEVMKKDKIMPMRGMSYGIHLTLKTDKGDVSVHLGPAWYINEQEPAIKVGDKVEVKGSKVTFQGSPVIIAQEVRKGGEVLKLRDDSGIPMWAGRRMGR
jgi:hypothetical protein